MNKFEFVRDILLLDGSIGQKAKLLDVGCRGCELKSYVDDLLDYEGVDLFQNSTSSVKYVLDVSSGIPVNDGSFKYVVALDLLEHLDDFEAGLKELIRISNHKIIIMLPNIAHYSFRFRFLLTARISGKYDLFYKYGIDRHRWFTTKKQSDLYMKALSNDLNLKINIYNYLDSKKNKVVSWFSRAIGLSSNFWVYASVYVIDKHD
jgi:hypothetical protein